MAGAAGKSAYQIAKEHGYNDTEENWLKSLKGERGLQGLQGPAGPAANLSEYIKKSEVESIYAKLEAYNAKIQELEGKIINLGKRIDNIQYPSP